MKPHQGMTLIELLVTLLVSSGLLLYGINGWQSLQEHNHARTAINRLVISINEARHLAMTRRKITTLCPSSDGLYCSQDWDQPLILFSGSPTSPDKTILRHYPANARGKTTWRSFRQTNMLQMNVNGLTLAYNGTFIYCPASLNPRFGRALVLNKSGRARPARDLNGDGIPDITPGETLSCVVTN